MRCYDDTLDTILKGTSRAFYLSLAVLPPKARVPLSLAYLLARAADTLADAPADTDLDRSYLLRSLRESVNEPSRSWLTHFSAGLRPVKEKEQRLLESLPDLLEVLADRPNAEAEAIRQVVSTLIDGMLWDQQLFCTSQGFDRSESGLDGSELENYTYLVAGCVGPFWSQICALSDQSLTNLLLPENDLIAVEFGKALQWINILRDVPEDHREGRFYLPSLQSRSFSQRLQLHARRAMVALAAARQYPLLFPSSFSRHRMAVFWPLVLALRTLEKLLLAGGPRPGVRVKVQRWEVLVWIVLSPLLVASDRLLNAVLDQLWNRAEKALKSLEEPHVTKAS